MTTLSDTVNQHDSITCDKYYNENDVQDFITAIKKKILEWDDQANQEIEIITKVAGERFA